MTYLESCTKYFAPLDEIIEALDNGEGISGVNNSELQILVNSNSEMKSDVLEFRNS